MLPKTQTLIPLSTQRENFKVELKLVLGVDGTRCRLGSSPQNMFPLGEVNAPPLGLGIIGARGFDEALLALATKLMQFVPKHAADQEDLIIVVITDVRVALWLDEIRQTLLQTYVVACGTTGCKLFKFRGN